MQESVKSGSSEAPVVPGLIRTNKSDGRNVYDPAAKRELARLCMKPGVSVARAALVNGVNANLLRKWIIAEGNGGKAVRHKKQKPDAAMLPVVLRTPVAPRPISSAPGFTLEIELARGRVLVRTADPAVLRSLIDQLSAR